MIEGFGLLFGLGMGMSGFVFRRKVWKRGIDKFGFRYLGENWKFI